MRIMIMGTGYVGLTVGGGFAELGNDVICFDNDAKKFSVCKRDISQFLKRIWLNCFRKTGILSYLQMTFHLLSDRSRLLL